MATMPQQPRQRSLARKGASLPMAKKALEPMLPRRDRVSSTECDRCPCDDHAVLGIRQQGG